MRKKILTRWSLIGVLLLLLVLVNTLLPKDFFGYYTDINMVRDDLSEIYDNGVLVHTQETKNRYTDFIVSEDIYIVKIKQKNTILGPKYRMVVKEKVFEFNKILENNIAIYDKRNEINFVSVGWLDQWPKKPSENVLWSVLPAEYLVRDIDGNISTYNFTYDGKEYVLYVKLEKVV